MSWIWLRTGRPDHINLTNVAVLLIPLALLLIAAIVWGIDSERLAMTVWAVYMLGAAFPVIYALNVGSAATNSAKVSQVAKSANDLPTALERYDRLFQGTLNDMVQRDLGQVEYMRTAMFDDGSRLELYHFPLPEQSANYAGSWTRTFAGRDPGADATGSRTITANNQTAHVYQYGNDVLVVVGTDSAGVAARVASWQLPRPSVRRAKKGSSARGLDQWPFAVGYGLAYLAVSFLFVIWIATWVGGLAPSENAVAVSPERLRTRLLALAQAAPGLEVEPGQSDDIIHVSYRYRSGKRNTQVRLRIDAERHQLFSRTYEGTGGDAPTTANERQMKTGTRDVGGLHPDADLVYSADWTVTVPNAQRRQQLGLRVVGDGLELPPEVAASFSDDDGAGAELLPYLLSELTHQSGWRWSPRLVF